MKMTIISMIVVLIIMVALPIIFLGDTDVANKLGFDSFGKKGSAPAKLPTNVKTVTTNKTVEIYTWVDENGVKQFSQTPHSEGRASVKIVLHPNTNIMDPVKLPEAEAEVASGPRVFSVGSPYTPGGMEDLVDGTKDIKDSAGERKVEQDKIMEKMFPGMNLEKTR